MGHSKNRSDAEALLFQAREPSHHTATEAVYAEGKQGSVTAVVLTPAAAAATATFRDGGSGGTIILVLSAIISGPSVPASFPSGLIFEDGFHLTLAGVGATVDVVGTAQDS